MNDVDKNNLIADFERRCPNVLNHLKDNVGDAINPKIVEQQTVTKTGILSLDLYLGALPSGITEIYGEPGAGKTALVGAIMSFAQQTGKRVALGQTEYFDASYLQNMGVDLNNLALIVCENRETFADLCVDFVSQEDALLCIDSISAFRPEEEGPFAWEEAACRLLEQLSQNIGHRSGVIVTSHVRAKKSRVPGKMFAGGTDSASRNIHSYMDARLELSREGVSAFSYTMLVNILANSLQRPGAWLELPVIKGKGVDIKRDFIDTLCGLGIVQKRGSYYYLSTGRRLGQGREQAAKKIFSDPSLQKWALEKAYEGG